MLGENLKKYLVPIKKGKNLLCIPLVLLIFTSISVARGQVPSTTVEVYPPQINVEEVGQDFTVNINVTDVTNLFAWEVVLFYKNDILNGINATEGPFLKQGGTTYFAPDPPETGGIKDDYNATHGRIHVSSTLLGLAAVNGTGVLVTIGFRGISAGESILKLESRTTEVFYTLLADDDINEIPFEPADGFVIVIPEFPAALIAPLLMITTLVAVILGKKAWSRKKKTPFVERATPC